MGSKIIILIIAIFFFYSCGNSVSVVASDLKNPNKIDTIIFTDSIKLFASFNDQENYRFIIEGKGIRAETGLLKLFPMGLPQVEWYNNQWVYMRGGCGTSCFFGYLLPVSNSDTLRIYNYPLFIEKDQEIIVYCHDDVFAIENFSSRRKTQFKDSLLLHGPYCGYSVENIKLQGSDLLFQITDDNKVANRKVDITLLQ